MCGIFGVLVDSKTQFLNGEIERVMGDLLRLSQSRGQEASGVATYTANRVNIRKRAVSGKEFIRSRDWRELFDGLEKKNGDPLVRETGRRPGRSSARGRPRIERARARS
jgi:glutamine phosphoribosylpyrophosphate amidotransferase